MDMSDPDLSLASQLSFMKWIVAAFTIKGSLEMGIQIPIDGVEGPCEICVLQEEAWKKKVVYGTMSSIAIFRLGF